MTNDDLEAIVEEEIKHALDKEIEHFVFMEKGFKNFIKELIDKNNNDEFKINLSVILAEWEEKLGHKFQTLSGMLRALTLLENELTYNELDERYLNHTVVSANLLKFRSTLKEIRTEFLGLENIIPDNIDE